MRYAIIFIIWLIGAIIVFYGFKQYEKRGINFQGDEGWKAFIIFLSWISVILYLIVVRFCDKSKK